MNISVNIFFDNFYLTRWCSPLPGWISSTSQILLICKTSDLFVVLIEMCKDSVAVCCQHWWINIPANRDEWINMQRRNEGDKGGAIPRAPNHCGGTESLREAPKSPNNVTCTFFNSRFASERLQVRTWGHQGHRQRGNQWCPAPPFEIGAPISRLAHRLLHTSNTVF